jgi:hypothetical protein
LRKAHEYSGACDRTGSGKERRQGERFMMIEVTAHQRHPVLMLSAVRLLCLPRASGVRGGCAIIESSFARTATGKAKRRTKLSAAPVRAMFLPLTARALLPAYCAPNCSGAFRIERAFCVWKSGCYA